MQIGRLLLLICIHFYLAKFLSVINKEKFQKSLFRFTIYAYLVCCVGSKGYCWPSIKTISTKTGISEHLKVLAKRQIIEIGKQKYPGSAYKNNTYTLLDLNNPEVYRDLDEEAELPFAIDDIPAA